MVVKEKAECPKCHTKPFNYDIIKIYNEKIEGHTKHRVRCRNCRREMILPYIKIKKKQDPSKKEGGNKKK